MLQHAAHVLAQILRSTHSKTGSILRVPGYKVTE